MFTFSGSKNCIELLLSFVDKTFIYLDFTVFSCTLEPICILKIL